MINLDPKIVDQETIRLERRKRYFKFAIFPLIALFILFCLAARQPIYNALFSLSYKNDNNSFANSLTQMQLFSNYAESYIAHYNEGVIAIKDDRYADAEKSFNTSINQNPPQDKLCTIYNNLSLSIELQADDLVATKTYDQAILFYTRAESILISSGCASKQEDGHGKNEKSDESKKRIANKRSIAVARKNEFENDGESDDSGGSRLSEDDINDIIRELQENNTDTIIYDMSGMLSPGRGGGHGGSSYSRNPTPW